MQVYISLQADNHTVNKQTVYWILAASKGWIKQYPTTQVFFTGRMPFLPPNQDRQSTEGSVFHFLIIRPHRTVARMASMRPIVTHGARFVVCVLGTPPTCVGPSFKEPHTIWLRTLVQPGEYD